MKANWQLFETIDRGGWREADLFNYGADWRVEIRTIENGKLLARRYFRFNATSQPYQKAKAWALDKITGPMLFGRRSGWSKR